MDINKASDLHFTYVKNTPELREAFIAKCAKFDIGVFAFSPGDRYLEVYADSGDIFEICGTYTLEESSKELAIEDLALEEKPSEKVEWVNGDECRCSNDINHEYIYIGKHPHTDGHYVFSERKGVVFAREGCLIKPETQQQREDRERLEAAYDLYESAQREINCIGYDSFELFKKIEFQVKFWLAIVDKTNYRISK